MTAEKPRNPIAMRRARAFRKAEALRAKLPPTEIVVVFNIAGSQGWYVRIINLELAAQLQEAKGKDIV